MNTVFKKYEIQFYLNTDDGIDVKSISCTDTNLETVLMLSLGRFPQNTDNLLSRVNAVNKGILEKDSHLFDIVRVEINSIGASFYFSGKHTHTISLDEFIQLLEGWKKFIEA